MCGIYGAFDADGLAVDEARSAEVMARLLVHRGPDQEGSVVRPNAILGSKRLAIIDPSPEAAQPFTSPDGNVVLVCNGEIYNAPSLRERYRGRFPFRSDHNDVEPVLALYLDRGEEAVAELDGMFALAIYDARTETLLLARDRAGEKPLFYCGGEGAPGSGRTTLRFASEIQALLVAGEGRPSLCPEGVAEYLALGYALAPNTLIAGVRSLEAGQVLTLDRRGMRSARYFDPWASRRAARPADAEEVLRCIGRVVGAQTRADVPLGLFLSGGVDSSLLAAEAVRVLPAADIHTYVARFDRKGYDESALAGDLARRLGTRHHVVDADERALLRALDTCVERIAEPMGDPAVLPAILLAEAAACDVKVVLSGEGADELFGGYPTYLGHLWARRFASLPGLLRGPLAAAARRLPRGTGGVPLGLLLRRFVEEAEGGARERHLRWFGALGTSGGVPHVESIAARWRPGDGPPDDVVCAMRFDFATYLAENLFTKIDRATMLAGIEARAPFVARDLIDLAFAQPAASAVAGLSTKRLLKRAAGRRLPAAIIRRRKRGLSVPVGDWLCAALRDHADELLAPAALERLGGADPAALAADVGRLLGEHRAGRADHARRLWPLLSLQLWYDRWVDQAERARSISRATAGRSERDGAGASADARSSVTR